MNLGLDHSNTYPLIETALDNKKMSKVVSVVDGALSSIWDPNSMASPGYCLDEEAQQNHRTRARPNRLVVSL
jgi:hypothetical protein